MSDNSKNPTPVPITAEDYRAVLSEARSYIQLLVGDDYSVVVRHIDTVLASPHAVSSVDGLDRYELDKFMSCGAMDATMEPDAEGDWVRWEDVVKLSFIKQTKHVDWRQNCQYLLDVLDTNGFMESDLGEDDEGGIKDIREALLSDTSDVDDYKSWYEEAMVASNEAGYGGMSAAEVIRSLDAELRASGPVIGISNAEIEAARAEIHACGTYVSKGTMKKALEAAISAQPPQPYSRLFEMLGEPDFRLNKWNHASEPFEYWCRESIEDAVRKAAGTPKKAGEDLQRPAPPPPTFLDKCLEEGKIDRLMEALCAPTPAPRAGS